ncbi:vesicular glutamate transporter 1-like [Macrobrachium rosenbergii]|uniref:vesicular glutamate transporter 1-like n=1 Tax=Macrobrachium rosenbergii TaxID=79674 RepID=UPI0034D64A36
MPRLLSIQHCNNKAAIQQARTYSVAGKIPGGRLAQMYGTKWVFGLCILGGGICALLSPVAARLHYGAFISIRVIHGLLQGVSWPSMHACLAQWIPPFERPRFIGTVYFGKTHKQKLFFFFQPGEYFLSDQDL